MDINSCYDQVQSLIAKHTQMNLNDFVLDLITTLLPSVPDKSNEACKIHYPV
jgi:hypothetical protein